MWMKPTLHNAGRCFAYLGLACLAIAVLSAAPAPGQNEGGAPPALLKARLDAAQKAHSAAMEGLQRTRRTGDVLILVSKPEEAYTWSVRWLNAQRDMSDKKKDHITALEDHLKRMKELQQRVTKQHEGGLLSSVEPAAAAWYLAEAELWLAKEKAKADSDKVQDRKPAQPRQDVPPKVEAGMREMLKGSWALMEVERSGKKTHVGHTGTTKLNSLNITFDGVKFLITYPGESGEIAGSYTLVAREKTADLDLFVCRDTTDGQVGEGRTDKYLCQIEG
ncbi:MAG TPA: hypothetical protein VKJ47_19075, partial [Candidatus Binatia bacterium]|nr:hypothetical protein [Candidatus Binatia bacterium]